MGKIFSPGKLLLTSEYVVLDGALALAVPTKLGQEFFFEENPDGKSLVHWEAFHEGKSWLQTTIDYSTGNILETNILEAAAFVLKVLKNIKNLSATKLQSSDSYFLKTNLQFPSNYGLGSSSTLMNNLAEWAQIDPFSLNEISLGGSGYDIAVAKEKTSILFQLNNQEKLIQKVDFKPSFLNELVLVHLNQKQDSREGINLYRSKQKSPELIDFFTNLTKEVTDCEDLEKFSQMMVVHEEKLSDFLQIPMVKKKYFENCPSFVKSLGAWGGDFVLTSKFRNYQNYFSEKGFTTILNFENLVY